MRQAERGARAERCSEHQDLRGARRERADVAERRVLAIIGEVAELEERRVHAKQPELHGESGADAIHPEEGRYHTPELQLVARQRAVKGQQLTWRHA